MQSSSTFLRFIDKVIRGLKGIYAFIDDILITFKSKEEHFHHLKAFFERLGKYGLAIKPSKCIQVYYSIGFLGFKISAEGLSLLQIEFILLLHFLDP